MTPLVAITPQRRLYCCGLRVHHGPVGILIALAGALIAWHDRADARTWHRLRDRC